MNLWTLRLLCNETFSRENLSLHFRNQYWDFVKLNFDLLKISRYLFDIDRNNALIVK